MFFASLPDIGCEIQSSGEKTAKLLRKQASSQNVPNFIPIPFWRCDERHSWATLEWGKGYKAESRKTMSTM